MNKVIIKIIKNIKMCRLYGAAPILSNHLEGIAYSLRGEKSYFVKKRQQAITKQLLPIDQKIWNSGKYNISGSCVQEDAPIWFFWYDGRESYPDVVRLALDSIYKNAGKHEVCELNAENIGNYVDVPEDIMKKVEEGKISVTHYSDILRFALLARYGGIWMDSTIYMANAFPAEIYLYQTYTMKRRNGNTHYISKGRWTTYFWGSGSDNPFMRYCYDFLIEYWRTFDKLVDYTFLDYLINIACEKHENFKEMFEEIPFNNEQCKKLLPLLRKPFDAVTYERLCQDTALFKLSWKEPYIDLSEGKPTFFAFLKGECDEYSNH